MKDNNGNKERLDHILYAIKKIEEYTDQGNLENFKKTSMLHDAVLLQLLIIGEAIGNIDNEILDKYDYPWHLARSFRNFIAHKYFGINLEQAWNTVLNDLPNLKDMISKIIKQEF